MKRREGAAAGIFLVLVIFWGITVLAQQSVHQLLPLVKNIQISAEENLIPVEFEFYLQKTAADSGVGINGSFPPGSWLAGVYAMKQVEPNLWKRVLYLPPGRYEYKFVTYVDTVGQAGVTGWYTDPLNPEYGGPYLNSIAAVMDPMIYYLRPTNNSVISEKQPLIQAKVSWAQNSQIDAQSLQITLDGVEITNSPIYFDSLQKKVVYQPPMPLPVGIHNAALTIQTLTGSSVSQATQFEVSNEILAAPYTFRFDEYSPNLQFFGAVENVDVKGDFNFFGQDPLVDPEGDGVYTRTVWLRPGIGSEYEYILNGGFYFNDPDNPVLSQGHKSYVVKKIDPKPRVIPISPKQGAIFANTDTLVFRALVIPSDSAFAIDPASVALTIDGIPLAPPLLPAGDSLAIAAPVGGLPAGMHILSLQAADEHGHACDVYYHSFGVFANNTGFHYIDGYRDDVGAGGYRYPTGVEPGSADLLTVDISASVNLDSLLFTIDLDTITANTRVGLSLVNAVERQYVQALPAVELQIPEWQDRGVFLILADPQAVGFNPTTENCLYTSRTPLQSSATVVLDSFALAQNQFKFALALADLQAVMGNFNRAWHIGAFSFLQKGGKPVEVGVAEKAQNYDEDPDVYDVAFCYDPILQQRLLANFIVSYGVGGSRYATIGTNCRGYEPISPQQIHADLGQQPQIVLFGNGGELLQAGVKIGGKVAAAPGSEVLLRINQTDSLRVTTTADSIFQTEITLPEGVNEITAQYEYSPGKIVVSAKLIYTYRVDHRPIISIQQQQQNNILQFDASASYDPDGQPLSFNWYPDLTNPALVEPQPSDNAITQVTLPAMPGEYYLNLMVNDGSDSAHARTVFTVSDTGYQSVDLASWHSSWIDTAVVYEIFVRTFSPAGKLSAVTGRMAQLKDLGINCIWFMPLHPSPTTHGYAITDYFGINPEYGTKEDFHKLVRTAHQNGIRVIMDYVVQHSSVMHPFMLDVLTFADFSPYYNFYLWNPDETFFHLFTWVDLPSINYESAANRDYLLRAAKYWVGEFDVDGFRCDVAWAVNDLRASGPAYWQRFRRELKAIKPEVLLLAEADYQPQYINHKFDAAYDWRWFGELKNIYSSTAPASRLTQIENDYKQVPGLNDALPFRFLENHDETRFIKSFGVDKTKSAAALMFASPGLPLIYAGQEVGELEYRSIILWSDPNSLRNYYRQLVGLRHRFPALSKGDFTSVTNTMPEQVYSFLRSWQGQVSLVVANLTSVSQTAQITVPAALLPFHPGQTFYLNEMLQAQTIAIASLQDFSVTLPPWQVQIYILADSIMTHVVAQERSPLPLEFGLRQNYPNPFNPDTRIVYTIGGNKSVAAKLVIYDVLGRAVRVLVNQQLAPGEYRMTWDGCSDTGLSLASGVYFYRLTAGERQFTRKLVLVR